ncbi:MAG TPA: long-chain fatty acid--CoA ligase [Anaerolineaceae bacterium]|nr:long-chain fatty acid--CoA ligase [Anaerolineaceae bacterium]
MGFLTFNDMLRRTAWRLPDHPFLYWSDRNRSITYAEGEQISDAVAGALADLGVKKGERVGIFAHNGLDYVMAMFGAWKLGAISDHINVLQAENLAWFVQDSTPTVLIYTGDLHEVVERNRPQMPSIRHYICLDGERPGSLDWNTLLAANLKPPAVDVDGEDAAHLSYTSGSSGKPKGAILAHGYTARATHCIAERLQLSKEDVSFGPTSLASSYHLVGNLLPGIHRGVYIGVRTRWNPEAAWNEMEQRGVTFVVANPLLLNDLLLHCRQVGRKPSALRFVVSGGAPVPPELKKAYQEELGAPLVESYGQSELGGFVALGYPRAEHGAKFKAIGPELPDREVRIADEKDNEVPIGTPGEILIRGGVMIGYHNLPEKTAEALRNGWLHTGDMGVMDEDGYIRLVGRWSERIIMHGQVIFPRPLEEALLRHPAVRYACVIAKKDPQAGQVPKAVVELYPDATATPEELMDHCNAVLGEENTIQVIEIIAQMPMTPTGKIGRADLQAREDQLA